jgi:hypothetical protein
MSVCHGEMQPFPTVALKALNIADARRTMPTMTCLAEDDDRLARAVWLRHRLAASPLYCYLSTSQHRGLCTAVQIGSLCKMLNIATVLLRGGAMTLRPMLR